MADVETPPPSIDVQDPLPESNWLYRRVFIFVLCTVIALAIWREIQTMIDLAKDHPDLIVGAFLKIIKWEIIVGWCAMTYYLIAPSAEQVGKWLATVSAWRAGVVTTQTQTATGPDGSRASATTTTAPVTMQPSKLAALNGASSETGLPVNGGTPYPWRK